MAADLEELFYKKVNKQGKLMLNMTTPCWEFTGHKQINGYYNYTYREGKTTRTEMAHRLSYILAHNLDELPSKLEIDHLCRNISCIRPTHLQLVSKLENLKRRDASRQHNV